MVILNLRVGMLCFHRVAASSNMIFDLSTSAVHRQNVLNNPYALSQLEQQLMLGRLFYKDATIFTKTQAADILAVEKIFKTQISMSTSK
jgi:hypothetical protein